MAPLVSVVLPTYNRAKTLGRAIESVLNQTFNDFELIIIDDGSTDETKALMASYMNHSQVRLICQPHRGSAAARNTGISAALGRYIAFQDSDDEWVSDKLEKSVAVLERSGPEVGVIHSDMIRIRVSDGHSFYFKSPEVQRNELIDEKTLDYMVCGIGISSAIIKRQCFEVVGAFDESMPRYIDLELFIRLSDHFEFIHQREPLVTYYDGEGIHQNTQAAVIARQNLLHKYRPRLEEKRHHLARQYLLIAYALYKNGNIGKACGFALKAFLTWPFQSRIFKDIHLAFQGYIMTRKSARIS